MRVISQKGINLRALMPLGLVDIKINAPTLETMIKAAEKFQEPFSISFKNSKESIPSSYRMHPSEKIKPLPMLALGRDSKTSPSFHPEATQSGMKREARFISKDQNRFFPLQDRSEFFFNPRRNRETPLPVAWSNLYPGLLSTKSNLCSQFRACRGLMETPQTFLRYSETVIPSQRARVRPNSLGSFSTAVSNAWAALEVTRAGLPDRGRSCNPSTPRVLASRIQATAVGLLNLKRLATAVDRHPVKTKIKAAIRIPTQAPGVKEACLSKFSTVISGLVILRGFMALHYRAPVS